MIRTLADSDAWVRRTAAWALGETKDGRAVDPLSNMLEDPEAEVRKQAAAALGEIRSGGLLQLSSMGSGWRRSRAPAGGLGAW